MEDRESQSPSDPPRFDIPISHESGLALPPHIPSHLQTETSFGTFDYNISSTASSPSAAYAGLSLEGERSGDSLASENSRRSLAHLDQDTRAPSPVRRFSHRSIMGGAADLPQRSSSPLKRRASDLDEVQSSQKDDVDMISVPPSDPPEAADVSTTAARSQRAQSVDVLKNNDEDAAVGASTEQSPEAAPRNATETGKTLPLPILHKCHFLM